jgi:hypothetical protein
MIRSWLDNWTGVGTAAEAMHAHGYDMRLFRSVFGWGSAEFRASDVGHPRNARGQAHAREPWMAVRTAAMETLANRLSEPRKF